MACAPADDAGNPKQPGGAGMSSGGVPGSAGVATAEGGSAAGATMGGSVSGGGAGATNGGGANGGSVSGAGSAGSSGQGGSAGSGGAELGPSVQLDPALMERCSGTQPIKCTIPVPENGNYNVTVELGSAQAPSTSQVQAELYRIVVPTVSLDANAFARHTFSVNVRAEDHDGYDAPGKELNILIDGDAPALHGLGYAAAELPTLFVVGDSTVCDWDPEYASLGPTERGWAQEFSQFLKPGLPVANYADSGDTAGSLYGKFASRGAVLKEGDFLFIQFGHNDQKTTEGKSSYKTNLMKFVTAARDKKATPVLFSPAARKSATLASPGFEGLDQQVRDLAQAEQVAFVDLTKLSINYYATVDKSLLFATTSESTHFNIAGATAVSKLVADALKAGTTPATSMADFLR
jgi:lysophospholipase L1-like esterase